MPWWNDNRPLATDEIEALTEHLATIPELYGQLPTIDEPERPDAGESNDDGNHAAPGSRAPINLTVVHLTDTRMQLAFRRHDPGKTASIQRLGTLPSLVWWTDTIARAMLTRKVPFPIALANPATVTTECSWLGEAKTFAIAQDWAPIYVRDIAAIHSRLLTATTGKREPWVPRCTVCNNRLHERDDGSWYQCGSCGKQFTPGSMVDLGRRQPPMPGPEIAAALGIAPETIRTWTSRKLLKPAKRDKQGRPLYYLADVLRVKERVRERNTNRKDSK